MKRGTASMISARHNVATPRTSAAQSITSIVRKRNRSPAECNLCAIDNEAFQMNDQLVVPKAVAANINGNMNGRSSYASPDKERSILLPSPPQEVGVFGVDSSGRINLWNDAAARVTGALSPKNACLQDFNEEEEEELDDAHNHNHVDDEHDDGSSRRVFGMAFEDLFPASVFEIAGTQHQPTAITLVDVLDKVVATGEPSMGVPVIGKAGRKRGRDEMTDNTTANANATIVFSSFSVDFLPQFKSCPMFVSSRNVSGVILMCRSEPVRGCLHNAIDMARSIAMDKPRSLSAGSSGTCPTETPTETETETEIDIDKEIETEIDNSFHTCQIDNSNRTNNNIDNSFRNTNNYNGTMIESSPFSPMTATATTNALTKKQNKRLEALEAFEASDSSDEAENDVLLLSHHLPSPPFTKRKSGTATAATELAGDNNDEDYRTLFETVDSIIFGVDMAGRINEWNHKMEELTGLSKDAVWGRSLLEDPSLPFLPYPDPSRPDPPNVTLKGEAEPVLSKALQGQSTSQFRLKLKSITTDGLIASPERCRCNLHQHQQQQQPDPQLRHLIASISPRYNKAQEVVGALFLATDMTDGFLMFHSIKTDAHELRKLIDTANAPIFGIDAHGYVNEWNDKTAEITGYSKDDAFGCLLVDTFIFPDIQDSVRAILRNALQHGKGTSNYELEFKTKSNEIRHLLVNITPQHDMNNVVVGVVLIAQDVTEAVERDRAVASMALELRQLIETANAPIFGIDVHGKVNEWNTRMSTITGFAKDEAVDIPLVENFIAPSMKEKVGEILEAALNGNETSNYEVEVPSKSGEPIFLLVNATTRRDSHSNVIGVVGVAQDVTEDRKHAKALRELETLRASQDAKVETERNMTAYFAHELRNPLGAIDSALAAMPDKLPENAQSLVTGMQLCTKFMSSIMNNLLDVRKMEEGKIRLSAAPVSIRKLLHDVHEMLSPSVKAGVEFRKLINVKGNDWVLGDAHRIEQVLTNVISNAIKYTVSGHIQISIEWENNNVKFICEDTGPGIPKSEQAKLFQRFVQRGGAPGTGLGLAIAKHIVDLTGGSIRFESDPSVKAGTTCVVLMALPPCKAPESTVAKKKMEKITEPISVLVIDDIKMNRTMVKRRILKGIAPNAKIKEAATGEEALMICATDKFDVMIVDQFMEGAGGVMVGTDVVFAMRRMRIDSVLIGCSGNDIGTQFFDAGADMVWQKPMPTNDQIIRDLRSSLDKRGIALSCT